MMSSTLNTRTSSIAIRTIKCNNGVEVPVLAFGTAIKPDGMCTKEDVSEDVKLACSEGFRHIDCAERYGNEESVGAALKELDVSRKELFIVTKFGTDPDPKASLQKSLSLMNLHYVDLFLLHAPPFVVDVGLGKTWLLMEELRKQGKAASIGISNARIDDIDEILRVGKIVPAVNQIELHPYCYQKAKNLVDYCHSRGIVIEVFCALAPLTQFPGGPVDAVVKDIACKLGATDDQVLLKWAHQVTYGGIVLVSSTSCKKARLEGYRRAFTGMPDLSEDQIKAISEAGARKHQRVYGTRMDEGPSV